MRVWRRSYKRPGSARRVRLLDCLIAVMLLTSVAMAAAWFDRVSMRTLSGRAEIADGDSLSLDGKRIRLRGIDAPELLQSCTLDGSFYACGRRAREHLQELVDGSTVSCRGNERDRYGRLLAYCTAGGQDLGLGMVESGWAIAYGDYGAAEIGAQRAGRGVWAGEFKRPDDWRAARQTEETPHDPVARLLDLLRSLLWGKDGEEEMNETL